MHIRTSFPLALTLAASFALGPSVPATADLATQTFDLWPGPNSGVPSFDAAVFQGRLCFRGLYLPKTADATGDELFCYDDGTGTVTLAADILPGGEGSFPAHLTVYAGELYFSAASPAADRELWRWDGVNPPEEVFDLRPGGGSAPAELTVYDGQLYFSADDDGTAGGRALWRFDGEEPILIGTNPMIVLDFSTIDLGTPRNWDVFDGKLYFPAPHPTNDGEELHRFDSEEPIVAGVNPRLIVDLNPGPAGSTPRDFTVHDDHLYFTAFTGTDVGRRLYRFNGTNVPTQVSSLLDVQGAMVSYAGDLLLFGRSQDPGDLTGTELWSYDGISILRLEPESEYLAGGPFREIAGVLYFIAARGNPLDGFDLYKYRGQGPPAPAVALFSTLGDANYPLDGFAELGGRLYFNARTSAGGAELWQLEIPIFADGFASGDTSQWSAP
jgi:ELWxxDGT repeat protein